jgi:hypothetical protein
MAMVAINVALPALAAVDAWDGSQRGLHRREAPVSSTAVSSSNVLRLPWIGISI